MLLSYAKVVKTEKLAVHKYILNVLKLPFTVVI